MLRGVALQSLIDDDVDLAAARAEIEALVTARLQKENHGMSRMFGSINQIGYVVRDIHAAMEHWVRQGVGPWFYIEDVTTDYFRYRGKDSDLKMSVALANSGDVQLELIQQRNDAPSVYKDFLDAGREGAQHIAYWSTDYQGLYDRAWPPDTRSLRRAASVVSRAGSPISIPNSTRAR